jgi:hypothetical protein
MKSFYFGPLSYDDEVWSQARVESIFLADCRAVNPEEAT